MAIAWGTLSIVLLLSFGEGMKRSFHRTSRGMGEGIGVLWPGATTRAYAGLPSGRADHRSPTRTRSCSAARIPEIAAISREYSKRVPVTRGTKTVNARVRGVDPSFGEMRNIIPQAGGRFLNDWTAAQKRRVVVLGDELATDLFGKDDPGRQDRADQPVDVPGGRA